MKPGIPVLMSSTVITPFCVTIGQKMSEFQKALFIVFLPNFAHYGYFN